MSVDLHRLVTSTAHLFATPTILTVTRYQRFLTGRKNGYRNGLGLQPMHVYNKLNGSSSFHS